MSEKANDKLTVKVFINKVLAGTATGVIVSLIANAIIGSLLKSLGQNNKFLMDFYYIVRNMQYLSPVLMGVLIGLQFNLNGMQSVLVGAATYLGSGAYKIAGEANEIATGAGSVAMTGIGDLINIMLTASLAVLVILWIGNKLGSLTIILLPIIVGGGVGLVGYYTLPFVSQITKYIGAGINSFTVLQPLLMCILIAISFSLLIISPISTVAIGIAIGVVGLGAGAANIGVTACTAVLVISSLKINKGGITLGIALGGMKMMMPNLVNYPIIAVPVALNAALCGIAVRIFNILGTPQSAGFGVVGLVGPITAYGEGIKAGASSPALILGIVMTFLVIPVAGAILFDFLCRKVFKLYEIEAFRFMGVQ